MGRRFMSDKEQIFQAILSKVSDSELKGKALRQFAMECLDEIETYDWSGIYVLSGNQLVLDAYVGEKTDHVEIPVGRGVCGTAVSENKNQVIDDVREIENYLSCSLNTRSEIVVLIRDGERVIGQIDIDGHLISAFDHADEQFLSELGQILSIRWND